MIRYKEVIDRPNKHVFDLLHKINQDMQKYFRGENLRWAIEEKRLAYQICKEIMLEMIKLNESKQAELVKDYYKNLNEFSYLRASIKCFQTEAIIRDPHTRYSEEGYKAIKQRRQYIRRAISIDKEWQKIKDLSRKL